MTDLIKRRKPRIIFRADGNSRIGLGHVVRSLALVQMLAEEFRCVFAIQNPEKSLQKQLSEVCEEIIILPEQEVTAKEAMDFKEQVLQPSDIVVLDGYNFDTDYQQAIKNHGCMLVCIDDIHAYHFVADVVISHVVGVEKEQFSVERYTKLYLGGEYALLRSEFLQAAKNVYKKADSKAVFICLGGADPFNYTQEVLHQCMAKAPNLKYYVVIGSANKHRESLKVLASSVAHDISLLDNLEVNEMLYYMQQAGAAITSASSVAYEYLCTNGILYLLQTAENQAEVYRYLVEQKIALPFSEFGENITAEDKAKLELNSSGIFDGKQQQQLLKIFKEIA